MTQLRLGATAFLVALVACSDATKPVDPAKVASISLTPAAIPIVKGTQQALKLSALGSGGTEVRAIANWTSSAPSVATVSSGGVVTAVDYGTATITAAVGALAAYADVVVASTPTARSYSVLDLGAGNALGGLLRRLSDSGDVLTGPAGTIFRNGVATTMAGCAYPITLNGRGHALCKSNQYDSVSSYAIWRNGTLTPLAASDTFAAQHFRAFALNDSDEVAGLFFMPTFVNTNCPTNGARCLSIWRNGQPSFPGYDAGGSDAMFMNNKRQVVVEYAMPAPDYGLHTTIFDVPTKTIRTATYGVEAFNDGGWGAIALPWVAHGSADPFRLRAIIMTPSSEITLGSGGATGINDSNVVVGTLDVGPFIWRGAGVSLLTNAATDGTWTITAAEEINNRGQIVGTADNSDGRKAHTVLLTPAKP